MSYILKTGRKGFDRLSIVNKMYNFESMSFLQGLNIKKGSFVIDVGCGIGIMSQNLAKLVGPEGSVIAIDQSSEQIELAKKLAKKKGIKNIEFIIDSAENLPSYNISADAIYSRLVLVHQKKPDFLFDCLLETLKIGGIVVCEEPITSSSFSYPASTAFKRHLSLYCNMGKKAGLDFDFGKSLPAFLENHGLSLLKVRRVQNSFSDEAMKKIAYYRSLECSDVYLKNKFIGEKALTSLLNSLIEFSGDKKFISSGVEMMQAVGVKKY
jgi:ubiquinone/menaquinone biosynthesis C-methylase UbiE